MISGTTIIKDGLKGGYPFIEAILALLPICDEFIVFNDSFDGTTEVLEVMQERYPKIKIVNEFWPVNIFSSNVLSWATNKSFEVASGEWLVHCQADEVFTEKAVTRLKDCIEGNLADAFMVNRRQTGPNFQSWNGPPHSLIRAGRKGLIRSIGDALMIHSINNNYIHIEPDIDVIHMFDVTRTFVSNFAGKSDNHANIWWTNENRNAGGWWGKTPEQWSDQIEKWELEGYPEEYTRTTSPYYDLLPDSLKFWVGKTEWYPRKDLVLNV